MKSDLLKTFFLIPGFGQGANDEHFLWLVEFLKKKGFKVVVADIDWEYRTISDYVEDLKRIYNQNRSTVNFVLGFSYGAVAALVSANELKPDKLYLCSLSPVFKEDLPFMEPGDRKITGRRRLAEMQERSGKELARSLEVPCVVFYGQKEAQLYPQLRFRCEETAKLARRSKLVEVAGAPHKIDHEEYKRAIMRELGKI